MNQIEIAEAEKPKLTIESRLGHQPSLALLRAIHHLQLCSADELFWLKLDGIRLIQLSASSTHTDAE